VRNEGGLEWLEAFEICWQRAGAGLNSECNCGDNIGGREMAVPERRSTVTPERWEPFRELEQVTDRMRKMLDETFGGLPSFLAETTAWTPAVDIEETDDSYVVEAELPGVKREDVNIEHVGNELTITGEIKDRARKGTVRRRTRRTGRFEYRVSLPDQVAGEKIDAKLDKGVLTVRVPKSQRAQRRKIEVKS
jgi:HSP20 family protein